MKSNKQRRHEIKAHRFRRAERQIQIRRVNARPVDRPIGAVAVTPTRLRATTATAFRILSNAVTTRIGLSVAGIAVLKKSGRRRNTQWWYEQAQGDITSKRTGLF
jgi:hypothetical protein